MDRPYLFQQQGGGGGGGALTSGAQGGRDGVVGVLDYATAAAAGGGGVASHQHGLFVGGGGGGSSSNRLPFAAASDHLSFFAPATMMSQQQMQQHLQMTMVPIMLYRPAPPLSLAPPLSQAAEDILRRLGNGTTGGGTATMHNNALLPSPSNAAPKDDDVGGKDAATPGNKIIGAGDGLQLLFEATMLQEHQESANQQQQQQQQQQPATKTAADPQPIASAHGHPRTSVLPPTPPQPAIKRKSLPLSSSSFSGRNRSHSHSHASPGSSTSSSRLSSKKRRKLARVVLGSNPSNTNKVVAKYGIMDVLCGRGGLANRHDGNLVYRKVVESNKALYKTVTNKRHRQFLAESIVLAIQQAGGRFLEQMNPVSKRAMMLMAKANAPHNAFVGTSTFVSEEHDHKIPERDVVWKEVPFQKAVLKTSQALRETDKATSGKGSGGGTSAAASVGSESPQEQYRRFPTTTSLPLSTAMSSPAPLSPPPRLPMNQQATASLSAAKAPTVPVAAASVVVLDATNNVCGNHSSSSSSSSSHGAAPSSSVATTGSASSSLANYHDARQDAVANGGGDNDDADMPSGEHERPSFDHGRMSNGQGRQVEDGATDDEDNDGAHDRVVEDDDDWSSSSSSSASSSPRYRRGAGVSFVPVASSHLALSHAFFQQQPAAKAG